jgi:hypothetical protein
MLLPILATAHSAGILMLVQKLALVTLLQAQSYKAIALTVQELETIMVQMEIILFVNA